MVDARAFLRYARLIIEYLGEEGRPLHEFASFLHRIGIPDEVLHALRGEGLFKWVERDGAVFYVLGERALMCYTNALLLLLKREPLTLDELARYFEPLPPEWRERVSKHLVVRLSQGKIVYEVLQEVVA